MALSPSIVADNTAPIDPDYIATTGSTIGHNVVESLSGCTLSGTTTGNITGVAMTVGALMGNGGLTETQSPSGVATDIIASGVDGCGTTVSTDQRSTGFARPQGTDCDAGAFEAGVSTRTLTVTGSGSSNGIVTGLGITCTSTAGTTTGDCSQIYADGTSVTLTATATTGSFITFSGGSCTTSPCTRPTRR